jgi:hypothetical protein
MGTVAVAVLGLWGLHRLGLWAEGRGWIHYRRGRGSSGSLSAAALEVQSLLEPSKRYVLEQLRNEDVEEDANGDPPRGPGR